MATVPVSVLPELDPSPAFSRFSRLSYLPLFNMTYYHKLCDTFFVQDVYPRCATREHIMTTGNYGQEANAKELSRQVFDTYIGDIVNHMERMEVNSLNFQLSLYIC
jgi:hypothetical protein